MAKKASEVVTAVWVMQTTRPEPLPETKLYFYEGELMAINGKVYVPKDRPHWAARLLLKGYVFIDGTNPDDVRSML